MATSPNLENLVRIGKLQPEPPAQNEIDGLIRTGRMRFNDARTPTRSLYSRSTSLTLRRMRSRSLRSAHGYRSDNRYLVFQALVHTLGMSDKQWRLLALCHERRNMIEYEGIGEIDEGLVA